MSANKSQKNQQASEGLSQKQALIIIRLARGETATAAAAAEGIDNATISHWKRQPRFLAALNRECAAALEDLRNGLRGIGLKAVCALGTLLDDEDPSIKLKAVQVALGTLKPFDAAGPESGIGPTDEDEVRAQMDPKFARELERQRTLDRMCSF